MTKAKANSNNPALAARMSDAERNTVLGNLAKNYTHCLRNAWGDDLFAAVLFGSVARGEADCCSDIDLLIIADGLPKGRLARMNRLNEIDAQIESELDQLRKSGITTDISPILKTPAEAEQLVPLYFDMVEDGAILYEKNGFFSAILDRLRASFKRLGSRRRKIGALRYWELKPDYKLSEVFSI